ncbi:MAG TPA: NADPH-dependent FMN reductase [Steroidobacteraceae bacterium]|jgi:NAD(P)H-dependent FMN reductase
MTQLIGISGSLRHGSFNTALLRAAATLLPEGATLDVRTLHGIPLYDGDVEAGDGLPASVTALKEAIVAADGVLLVTPEYNNSIPGVFKNAVDWLSRPAADIPRVFGGRPFALMGASPGPFGTTLSQAAWLPVLRTLGTRPWFGGRMLVTRAADAFDATLSIIDAALRERLRSYLAGFVAAIREGQR